MLCVLKLFRLTRSPEKIAKERDTSLLVAGYEPSRTKQLAARNHFLNKVAIIYVSTSIIPTKPRFMHMAITPPIPNACLANLVVVSTSVLCSVLVRESCTTPDL